MRANFYLDPGGCRQVWAALLHRVIVVLSGYAVAARMGL